MGPLIIKMNSMQYGVEWFIWPSKKRSNSTVCKKLRCKKWNIPEPSLHNSMVQGICIWLFFMRLSHENDSSFPRWKSFLHFTSSLISLDLKIITQETTCYVFTKNITGWNHHLLYMSVYKLRRGVRQFYEPTRGFEGVLCDFLVVRR